MDFNKLVFNDTEINLATDFPTVANADVFYQVNADLTVPVGKAGAGTEFKEGNVIAWDSHATGTSGAGEWVVFGAGNGSGFISNISHVTASGDILLPATIYRSDSANDVVLTPVAALRVDAAFFYVEATAGGNVLIPLVQGGNLTVSSGTRVGIIYDDDISDWSIFIADAGVTSSISHFVGFFSEPLGSDPLQTNYYMDLFPITPGVQIDLSKYNLFWEEDNSPSWKIISGAIAASSVTQADIKLEY